MLNPTDWRALVRSIDSAVAPATVFRADNEDPARANALSLPGPRPLAPVPSLSLSVAAEALRARRVTSVALVEAALARIEQRNPSLNAFLTVLPGYALERAAEADRELAAGTDRGPLHGLPVAVKDLFDMRGLRTSGGARIYDDTPASENAAVVDKLEAAGAVILGKLNLHELAYGITSENPHFGTVRNPWNLEHIAGGSSGGSAAAVAADLVFAALGTDTGGSIRIPSAFCGTVGFKPTFGLVSRYGAQPLGYSLDHVGPLARTVRDAATVLNVIAGYDPRDRASVANPVTDYVPAETRSLHGIRIGVPVFTRVDAEVECAIQDAVARAVSLGAKVKSVTLPDWEEVNTVGQVLLLAEAAAVFEKYLDLRDSFGSDVIALLDQGRSLPATDYIHAQRLRRRLQSDFQRVWSEVDCLFTPASPIAAPRLGQAKVSLAGADELVRPLATWFSRPMNVLGLPALSLPCGLTTGGLPIGLQIAAAAFQDSLVLRIAGALEANGVGISTVSQ